MCYMCSTRKQRVGTRRDSTSRNSGGFDCGGHGRAWWHLDWWLDEGTYPDVWVWSVFRRWAARKRAVMREHGSHTQGLASQWEKLAAVRGRGHTGKSWEVMRNLTPKDSVGVRWDDSRREHTQLFYTAIWSLRIGAWFRVAQVMVERQIAGECRGLRRRNDELQCGGSENGLEPGDRLRVEEPCLVWVLRMV